MNDGPKLLTEALAEKDENQAKHTLAASLDAAALQARDNAAAAKKAGDMARHDKQLACAVQAEEMAAKVRTGAKARVECDACHRRGTMIVQLERGLTAVMCPPCSQRKKQRTRAKLVVLMRKREAARAPAAPAPDQR